MAAVLLHLPVVVVPVVGVVARHRVVGIAEAEEDGDDAVDLLLAQAVPHDPRYGAHGPDEGAGIGGAGPGPRGGGGASRIPPGGPGAAPP